MKKLLLIVGLLFLAGCTQKTLTWTPTQQEWQLMSPSERNDWFRSENEARQHKAAAWRNWNDSLDRTLERRIQMETSYGRIQQISPPSNTGNSTYWQEQQAQQEWQDRQYEKMGIGRYSTTIDALSGAAAESSRQGQRIIQGARLGDY